MNLACAVCLLLRPFDPRPAVTIANGHATCVTHLPYVTAFHEEGLDYITRIAKGNEVPE